MEDALTEAPPPSRFFEEDLNNFTPKSPPLPPPFLLLNPNPKNLLNPTLLIISISPPSLHLLHHFPSKTLIGTLILPELPRTPTTIKPSLTSKTINLYSLNLNNDRSVVFVSVQCSISPERSHAVAKILMDGIRAEKVVVLDSIQGRNFRGKLPPDETLGFKLETNEQRLVGSVVRGLDYFTSGSVVDGLGAAILARCQMRKSLGTLCVTWPEFGGSAMLMVKSVLREVLPEVEFGGGLLGFDRIRDPLFESDLYT